MSFLWRKLERSLDEFIFHHSGLSPSQQRSQGLCQVTQVWLKKIMKKKNKKQQSLPVILLHMWLSRRFWCRSCFAVLLQQQGSLLVMEAYLGAGWHWFESDPAAMPYRPCHCVTNAVLPQQNHKHAESQASKCLDLMIQIKVLGHCSLIPAHNLQL